VLLALCQLVLPSRCVGALAICESHEEPCSLAPRRNAL
jgi:hypothetical protein